MSTRVPFGYASLDFIKDVNLRNVLRVITQNITRLYDGGSSSNERSASIQDLVDAGVIGLDRGNLYNKSAAAIAGFQDQVSNLSSSQWFRVAAAWSAGSAMPIGSYEVGIELPTGATIIKAFYKVTTPFDSASHTAKIQLNIPTDDVAGILAATVVTSAGTAGWHPCIQTGVPSTFSATTTAIRNIEIQVSVQDLTAGALELYVEYVT